MPDLADHIARIAQDEALPQRVEEAARQTAVLPVLDALGWDCWDGNEVTPEFEVRGGRVDYCLQIPGRRLVLIEVKRTGTDLTGHQEQLLRYAFDEGVPLAALTDGRVWWLYLSTAAGNWEQRRFFNIDFRQQEAASAAAALERFLSREGVASGTALREAQREFESQERDRRVRASLQEAWKQVLSDPDGLLRDLLAETVKEISGHDPDPETVAGFLQGISGSGGAEAERPAPPPRTEGRRPRRRQAGRQVPAARAAPASESASPAETAGAPAPTSFRGRRVAAFLLDGARHEVKSWPQLVQTLSDQLAREAGAAFAESVAGVRGRTRAYFSERPDDLQHPRQLTNSSLYVEGSLGPDRAARISRRILIAVRGSDDGFRIDLADEPVRRVSPSSPSDPTPASFKGRHPAAFWLGSGRYEVRNWRELLPRVCGQLLIEAGPALVQRIAEQQGQPYFRSSPPDSPDWVPIADTGRSVYVNITADVAADRSRRVVRAVRGSDDGFHIELADEPASPLEKTAVAPPSVSFKGRSPAAFWLDGNRYEAARWNEVLRGICERLATEAGPAFAERVVHLRGRRRPYFSSSPSDLRVPLQVPGADLYAEGNFSANDCVRHARRVLTAVRGSDDGFDIELAE